VSEKISLCFDSCGQEHVALPKEELCSAIVGVE